MDIYLAPSLPFIDIITMTMSNTHGIDLRQLEFLNFNRKSAFVTNLFAGAVFDAFYLTENMFMLFVSSSLPNAFFSPFSKVFKTLFKFLILFLLLVGNSAFVLCIQGFRRSPFFPGEFFNLTSQKKHHIRISRFVGIGLEYMR